jgi:hypothetical protein
VGDETLFVNLFHSYYHTHYHFFFDISKKEIVGKVASTKIVNYSSNFPFKCMYNDELGEIYSFYRQGEAFIVKQHDAEDY